MPTRSGAITQLLSALRLGEKNAEHELIKLVYPELHRMAKRFMRGENPGHTLQPTALVNEAYLRMIGPVEHPWQNRAHFFAIAAQAMRRILVDHARTRRAQKRGGKAVRVDFDAVSAFHQDNCEDVIALDRALTKLAALDERSSRVVELRYFVGLNDDEIAEVLKISSRSVERDWRFARAWLYGELTGSEPHRVSS